MVRVRACGPVQHILLVTDGLASYKSQALKVFRQPLRSGKVGRPRLVLDAEAEVICRVIGTQRSIKALINTAYIERLNATFRARLAPLVRKTRAGAHKRCTLSAGMWMVGGCYNFVWTHCSLGDARTPAVAAGLTDHRWSMEELLTFAVPPAELPRWRGRKPKWLLEVEHAA
jgi:hypothetical protein